MSSKYAIEIHQLSKLYHRQNQYTLKEFLPAVFGLQSFATSFWALKNVTLDIARGESFGVIGTNGSGKSTLLKLIAGVTVPTLGQLKVNGRIAPLIELGTGFHPELTGRENIFLNGIILGLKRRHIAEILDDIVDFSELREFIDQPVKHYSSGMYLRLAYAVAIHTQPDILLIDEILAVGDEAFQKKCLDRVKLLQQRGVTIIIISHEREIIKKFTTRALLLNQGQPVMVGTTAKVLKAYNSTQ